MNEFNKNITYKNKVEWFKKGQSLFGENYRAWKFVCPCCKRVTSVSEYEAVGGEPDDAYRNCIGRFTGGRAGPHKCDWAAYGLFRGPSEILDGNTGIAVFNFYEDDDGPI